MPFALEAHMNSVLPHAITEDVMSEVGWLLIAVRVWWIGRPLLGLDQPFPALGLLHLRGGQADGVETRALSDSRVTGS